MISFTPEDRILVTGAGSGIGRGIALRCNELGASIVANGRDRQKLLATQAMSRRPEHFHLEPRDLVEDTEALPDWVKGLREKYGKLRGLVPAAGVSWILPLRDYDRAAYSSIFDLHFHAPILLAKGFADRRNNTGQGAGIVFITTAGHEAGLIAYASAKGAVAAATGVLSKELASQGIRVNALAPALVKTPPTEIFLSSITPESRKKEFAAYPFGLGEPEDVAGMAAFLLSDAGRWITGQIITLDGGRY